MKFPATLAVLLLSGCESTGRVSIGPADTTDTAPEDADTAPADTTEPQDTAEPQDTGEPDEEEDPDYMEPIYMMFYWQVGVVDGEIADNEYGNWFGIWLIDQTYAHTGNPDSACQIWFEVSGAGQDDGFVDAGALIGWHVPEGAYWLEQGDCDLDPEVWGADVGETLSEIDWGFGIGEASEGTLEMLSEYYGETYTSAAFDGYVHQGLVPVEPYYPINYGLVYSLGDDGTVDIEAPGTFSAAVPDGFYYSTAYYAYGL